MNPGDNPPLLSAFVLVRNTRRFAGDCLRSLFASIRHLGLEGQTEYLLIDDCSDPSQEIIPLLQEARAATAAPVTIVRFTRHLNFTHGMACGMSLAKGRNVLFISHDMQVAPACIRTLLEASAADPSIGIIRCSSAHMDMGAGVTVTTGRAPTGMDDLFLMSEVVSQKLEHTLTDTPYFVCDSMFATRALLDRIGVFDTRFVGLLSDIDYGIRALRAGFRVGVVRGAWLHHEGWGTRKDTVERGLKTHDQIKHESWLTVFAAHEVFRRKWGDAIPEKYSGLEAIDVPRLCAAGPADGDYVQPMTLDPSFAEIL